jgi:hypothetical protein
MAYRYNNKRSEANRNKCFKTYLEIKNEGINSENHNDLSMELHRDKTQGGRRPNDLTMTSVYIYIYIYIYIDLEYDF